MLPFEKYLSIGAVSAFLVYFRSVVNSHITAAGNRRGWPVGLMGLAYEGPHSKF